MINIIDELSSEEFDNLINELETTNDIDNSLLILQLIKLNLEKELTTQSQQTLINENKEKLVEEINEIIQGFLETPGEWLGIDVYEHVKEKTTYELLPKTKKEREKKSLDIAKKIAQRKIEKNKSKENIKNIQTKKELQEKLKKVKKEIEIQKQKKKEMSI